MSEAIYYKNINAMKKIQPSVVSTLENVDIENQDEFIVIQGPKGHNVLKVKKEDGKYIQYNSSYDPNKEAVEIASKLDYTINRSLIVAVGGGLGYHLEEIIKNLNEKSVILVVEKSKALLKNLLMYMDFSEAIDEDKIFFAIGDFNDDKLSLQLATWMKKLFVNINSIQPVVLPVSDVNYIRYCKEVLNKASELRDTFMFTLGNDIDDTLLGIENRYKNISHIIKNPGLSQLLEKYSDAYRGKPAIIIASGPSLDKNIHLLNEAKGKALLLACDGSMEALKKHGIVPDAVSSVERIMLTYKAFYEGKQMPDDTVLIAPAVVRPEIFKTFKTKTLSNFKSEGIADWFNNMVYNKGSIWSGASVAHHLLGFAHSLGADPIILVGQDLAYSSEGVSHVSDAAVKEKVDLSKVEFFVKDIHGKDVPTTFVWKQFLEIYEHAISGFSVNCIDATEGGAYIKGTKLMTLREAIDTYCIENTPPLRELVDSLDVGEEYIRKAYDNALRCTIRLAKMYWLIKKRCEKSYKLNEKSKELLDKGITTDEELDQVYDAMDYTENKIVGYIRKSPGLNMFYQYPIMVAVNRVNELGSEITLEVLSKNLDIHKELLNVSMNYSIKMLSVIKESFYLVREQAESVLSEEELDKRQYSRWS